MHVDKAAVEASVSDELLMGAVLDNGAMVHDDDFVGMADGGKTVGDDDASTALHEMI